MESLAEVLRQIRPCDTSRRYVFISYSSEDADLVWRDVLEFQRQGYNVWLDEKNLDKTKSSWKADALNAIEDMECELVVFYVSSSSLRSKACYEELRRTVAQRTVFLHDGPVKFIAVDAEEVGDITGFRKRVYDSIRNSNLTKEERADQAVILGSFMEEFFNSNNEKVRIRPKNERNRGLDYYEDILAAFPPSTRIFTPEPKRSAPAEPAVTTPPAAPETPAAPAAPETPAERREGSHGRAGHRHRDGGDAAPRRREEAHRGSTRARAAACAH